MSIILVTLIAIFLLFAFRFYMFSVLVKNRKALKETIICSFQGMSKDLLFLTGAFLLFSGPLLFWSEGNAVRIISSLCIAIVYILVIFFNLLDTIIYYHSHQRLTSVLLDNISLISLYGTSTKRQRYLIMIILVAIIAVGVLIFIAFLTNRSSFQLSTYIFALSCLIYAIGRYIFVDTNAFVLSDTLLANSSSIRNFARLRADEIRKSAILNTATTLQEYWSRSTKKNTYYKFTVSERQFLKKLNLLDQQKYAGNIKEKRYKRIILVAMEAFSQSLLSFYNPRIPKDTTPFLSSLLEQNPRLDNLWTSNLPTTHGLYALLASRLAYNFEQSRNPSAIDTLPSLLREKGYSTHMVNGVTKVFGNKDIFFPNTLRFEHLWAEEEIRALWPDSLPCGWGLPDTTSYSFAVHLLEQNRDNPIFLTLLTLDTHYAYYFTLPEDKFPQNIKNIPSRLIRAVYEADHNLRLFFMILVKKRLFDKDTLLIITSDHSPNQGPDNLILTGDNDFSPKKIPLIFLALDTGPFGELRQDIQCNQLDIMPTLIEGLGLRNSQTPIGNSLFTGKDQTIIKKHGETLSFTTNTNEYFSYLEKQNQGKAEEVLRQWYFNTSLKPYIKDDK